MRLLLHIGTEKTGTTLLQDWLYANRSALSAQGVFLSQIMEIPNNRKFVAYFQSNVDDYTCNLGIKTPEGKAALFAGYGAALEAELAAARPDHHTMVITSEHFHSRLINPRDIATLAEYLRACFSEIRVLCYFREQASLRESLYSTALRHDETGPLSDYDAGIGLEDYYYNCHAIASRWAEAFGQEALLCRVYDRARFVDQDIRRDFLAALSQGFAPGEAPLLYPAQLDFSHSSSNESLSPLQGRLFQGINRGVPFMVGQGEANRANWFLKAEALHCKTLIRGRMQDGATDQSRREIAARFAASNQQFFATFLPGEPGFDQPATDPGVAEPPAEETGRAVSVGAQTFDLSEVGDIVEDLGARFSTSLGFRLMWEEEALMLRDVAMKYDSGAVLSREEALALMRMAQRMRPHGPVINRKIADWESEQANEVAQ
ncbi:MAG: hypothetical protein MJH10_10690 [Epibacterium sp.]|nr:hypothetical protein [Epibacterium sp.]NQX74009.1 hypothetical protein [Epibacterium sp.]